MLGQLVLTAQGRRDACTITGTDYPTRDGTGLRDYIHVWDLALAHVRAVERFDDVLDAVGEPSAVQARRRRGCHGTGVGRCRRERPWPAGAVQEALRRPGDVPGAYANVDRARDLLGWTARSSLRDGVESAFRWAAKRAHVVGYD